MYGALEGNEHLQVMWRVKGRPSGVTETFSPTFVTSEPVNSMFCEGDLKDFPGQCAAIGSLFLRERGKGKERERDKEGEREREEGK